jgi:hypothetical protein
MWEPTGEPRIDAWESFSYPLDLFTSAPNRAGDTIRGGTGGVNESDVNGEGGWTSPWILEATSYEAVLSDTQIDTHGSYTKTHPHFLAVSLSIFVHWPSMAPNECLPRFDPVSV